MTTTRAKSASLERNLFWHHATVDRTRREAKNGHRGGLLWMTGLSGSGKSTLAHAVEEQLHRNDVRTYVLDGDNVRHGLCSDLGFSLPDRAENVRRVGQVAKLFVDAGLVVLTAFISPLVAERQRVRELFAEGDFLEVYCRCPLEVCEQRDAKGLYARARSGELTEFTGVSSPYQPPVGPELVVDTTLTLDRCVEQVMFLAHTRGLLPMQRG